MINETFDFSDGMGPVPAHRHPNGGGWVANSAAVSITAYVGPEARVYGQARIYGYAAIGGFAIISDTATIGGSAFVGGTAAIGDSASIGGSAVVTRTPVVVTGFEYTVTICDAPHVCVGCQTATLEEWAAGYTPEKAPLLEAARDVIVALARFHHNGSCGIVMIEGSS